MKVYPRVIATVQDFINLLAVPEFKKQALADLQTVYDLQDDTMQVVKSYDKDERGQMTNVVTETVPTPWPRWKRLGFASKQDAADLINLYAGN